MANGSEFSKRPELTETGQVSEEHYRSLFENMLNGYAYCRMLFEEGEPKDFIYLNVNSAFETLTGLKNVIGKMVTEVIPGIRESDPELFEIYARVARTGVPERFETYVEALGMWFSISVYSPRKEHFVAVFDVITERKLAEEKALRAKEEWERTFDGMPDLIAILDTRHRIVRVNMAMAERLGATPDECVGLRCCESVHGSLEPPKFCPHTLTMIDGQEHIAEVHEERLGGDFLVSTTPLRDAQGVLIGAVHVARDITERMRMEADKSRLAAIVESSDDAIIGKTLDGEIITWNRAAEEIYGYTAEEIIGQSISVMAPNDSPDDVPAILQKISRGEEVKQYDALRRRKDGRNIHVSLTVSAIRDASGKILGASTIARDITERKQMEEALRASEGLYRAIGESIDYGVWVCAPDGRNTYASESFLKLVGITQQECSDFGWGDVLHPEDAERTIAAWQECVRTGGIWDIEHRFLGVDGQWHPILARGVPVKDESGEIVFWAGINLDISERKKMEDELRKSRDELELRVQERTTDLKNYMAKLEQSNQALQDFASIAAHDLKEPLRKVISFGNMLRQKSGDSLGQTGNDYLDRMLNATGRMQSLLWGLLDYSRVATAAEPFKEVDLSDLIGEVISDLEVRIVTTGGEVNVGTLPVVSADPTQMRQLFQNLIGNALKFHKPGEKPIVRVHSISNTDSAYQIIVEDNGIGFDEQYLERIFAPFQRLHGRSSQYEGTGMG
ncbi:MAG: PAS domain S-box protein, partial [Syntrophobacteraceae bacterium]